MEIDEYIELYEKFKIIEAYESMIFVGNVKAAIGMFGKTETE